MARAVRRHVRAHRSSPEKAPDKAEYVEVDFEAGNPVRGQRRGALARRRCSPRLNEIGGRHGIGRVDLVENRYVGMKSRGVYETPGGTILHVAHRAVESITLDREVMHLRDSLIPRYAEMVYYGYWFAPERTMLQAAIDESQRAVTGTARLKLYKGNAIVAGRKSRPLALQPRDRHLRGRPGLPPGRRRGLHPAERAAPAHPRDGGESQVVSPYCREPVGPSAGPTGNRLTG